MRKFPSGSGLFIRWNSLHSLDALFRDSRSTVPTASRSTAIILSAPAVYEVFAVYVIFSYSRKTRGTGHYEVGQPPFRDVAGIQGMLFEGWELDCDQAVFDGRTPDLILIYILMEEFGKTGAARSAVKNDFPGVGYGVLRRDTAGFDVEYHVCFHLEPEVFGLFQGFLGHHGTVDGAYRRSCCHVYGDPELFQPFPDAYLVCSAAPASAQYQRSLFHVITSLRCHEGSAALVVRPLRVCAGPGCHIELYYMSRGASIGRRMSSRRSRIFTAPGSERREKEFFKNILTIYYKYGIL